MKIDSDTLKNFLKNLGRQDFKSVVDIVLRKVFHLKAIDVDGRDDGGTDRRAFTDDGGTKSIAFQVTVQESEWKKKALADARKAVSDLGANRYFFLTTRERSNTDLRQVENDITMELKIPATCLGAKEIAELIDDADLTNEVLVATRFPGIVPDSNRPDKKEVLLYSYLAFGDDTRELRDEIYDETLLLTLNEKGPLGRKPLVNEVVGLLGCPESRADRIARRIDSLLAKGLIVASPSSTVAIGPKAAEKLQISHRVYDQEFADVRAVQESLMKTEFNLDWGEERSRLVSVLLARAFISKQLELAKGMSSELNVIGFLAHIGDPIQQLRDYLQRQGIPIREITDTISELVNLTKDLPLIKKLVRAAFFVAFEGVQPSQKIKALNFNRWSDVTVIIDTSVAIPLICAKMYTPTKGRFSLPSVQSIMTLQDLGAETRIPYFYLNECASHLLRARDYEPLAPSFGDIFIYSPNGFIAHYYQLRAAGKPAPETLLDYLATFAPSIKSPAADKSQWSRKIMTELQPLFREYNIDFEPIDQIPDIYRIEVEQLYTFKLSEMKRTKSAILVDNDVKTLAHMHRMVAEFGKGMMCLTWDGAMIASAKELSNAGWVVSPDEANDITQASIPLSETKLCALAHALARGHDMRAEMAAKVLDRVVHIAGEKLQDWQFRQQVSELKEAMLASIDVKQKALGDQIDIETDRFLKKLGLTPESKSSGESAAE